MSVAVPVPPTIRISQTIKAEGRVFVRVSVIVGLAACPVPLAVIVHSHVWPVPATADAAAVLPHPALSTNSPLVQAAPKLIKDGAVVIPANLFVTVESCPIICKFTLLEGGFRNVVPNVWAP